MEGNRKRLTTLAFDFARPGGMVSTASKVQGMRMLCVERSKQERRSLSGVVIRYYPDKQSCMFVHLLVIELVRLPVLEKKKSGTDQL